LKSRLKTYYENVVVPKLIKDGYFKNKMAVPCLVKIIVNMGFGDIMLNKKAMDKFMLELSLICCQKSVLNRAKKSVAGFKLRKGNPVGCKVTLRRVRMYNFLDRVLSIILPRVRDFRGLSLKSFDGFGNYSFGIKEHIIFPEIDYDNVESIKGMDVTIVTSANVDMDSKHLLKDFKIYHFVYRFLL